MSLQVKTVTAKYTRKFPWSELPFHIPRGPPGLKGLQLDTFTYYSDYVQHYKQISRLDYNISIGVGESILLMLNYQYSNQIQILCNPVET